MLRIFGNANLDDTIDERDIEYVRGIIDGTKDTTELADANHDGIIDEKDIEQIEAIISGNANSLIISDNNKRIVTINQPADNVVVFYRTTEQITAIGAKDKLVGCDATFMGNYMPEIADGAGLRNIVNVGTPKEPNYEKILELMPDIVISPYPYYSPDLAKDMASHLPNKIPVAGIDFYSTYGADRWQNLELLGYIVGKPDKSRSLVDWIKGYEDKLVDRTKDLTSEEKPRVLSLTMEGKAQTTAHGAGMIEELGGGRNLAYGIAPVNADSVEVSNEWIVTQDPEVIFVSCSLGWDTTQEEADSMLKEFINKPGWDRMSAVKNNRVYLVDWSSTINRYIVGGCFMAKCIHPELFKDIDPESVNKEYFKKFLGFNSQGTWTYPAAP